MIDLATEKALSLNDASRLLPAGRSGKRCHFSTVLRWILKGTKALDGSIVKLDALRLGGRWITSREGCNDSQKL